MPTSKVVLWYWPNEKIRNMHLATLIKVMKCNLVRIRTSLAEIAEHGDFESNAPVLTN